MTVVSKSFLLEAGVHFGHQTKRWNPKMREYIFTSRDDIYIIDLQKTAKKIEEAYNTVKALAENGGKVLFVGTKKQVQEITKEAAVRSDMYYVNYRWLGGTLTNFKTIRKRVNRLEQIERMEKDGTFEALPKKEVIGIKKEYEKLNRYLNGIREMKKLPQAIFVVDTMKDEIAIKEAKKLGIKVIGLVDTNCDPDLVDCIIPANDDAIRAVKLILGIMANAIVSVNGGTLINYVTDEDKRKMERKAANEKIAESTRIEQTKVEVKPVARVEPKPVAKVEPKPVARVEAKPVVKVEPKPVAKVEPKTVAKVEPKPVAKVEPKPVAKVEPKPVAKVEPKPVAKVEVKKEETKVDLSTLKVVDLKEMAKKATIDGYSKMKKDELIKALS